MTIELFRPAVNLGDWKCESADELLYRKELIYEGTWRQGNGFEFSVDGNCLDHWNESTKALQAAGIDIPVPKGHTEDSDARRGTLIGTERGIREDGKQTLYGLIRFKDKESADLAKDSQVSIFSPAKWTDGTGKEYVRPLRHVAITDYPVVPGLKGFESIAASFVDPSTHEEKNMPLKELAKRLNIECDDEAKLADAIVASFESVSSAKTDLQKATDTIMALEARVAELSPKDPITVSAAHVNMLRDNRSMKLEKLVNAGKITPHVREELEKEFCTDASLSLVLSQDANDKFDHLCKLFAENEPVAPGTATVKLSKDILDKTKNPLIADMEARSAAS